jgi:hypothetical protein
VAEPEPTLGASHELAEREQLVWGEVARWRPA